MAISGISAISGLENYRISSIHGNPSSMNAVQRIGKDSSQAGKSLILARKEPEEGQLYVKDFGKLDSTKSTATGSFADLISAQEDMLSSQERNSDTAKNNYSNYLNDTIGVMGQQNRLREQLLGTGFTPFM